MKLTYTDIKYKLLKNSMVEFDICPFGGHYYNRTVERRIRQIKEPFEKNIQNISNKMRNSIINDSKCNQ